MRDGGANGGRRIVCLGEALVDLIRTPGSAGFEIHFGGALANAAVAVARAGAPVALAGACGEDEFGTFLRERLAAEGVDLDLHQVQPGLVTPFALVHLAADGEPSFSIHGDSLEEGLAGWVGREQELIATAEALVIGSNTLSAEPGYSTTLAALHEAVQRGRPVAFDPNLRPRRWETLADAISACRTICASATIVKANLFEARVIAGDDGLDAAAAAAALHSLGPSLAVVTAGPGEAVCRGAFDAEATPEAVVDPQPIGAGDAFMGALVAGLHTRSWKPEAIAAALPEAVAAGSAACHRRGAID